MNFRGARKPFIIALLSAAARLTPMGILVRYRRGFGVIELAIAMVILGIVFVMTLKAGVLVDSIRAVMVTYQIQSIQNRILVYRADYAAFPGDDPRAARRFGRENAMFLRQNAVVSFVGDDKIDGKLSDALSPNGEQFMAWRDLRYAGAWPGDPKTPGLSALPENPFGGVYGFDEGNLGQTKGSICATRIPGHAAAMIDDRLDDGLPDKGAVVATSRYDSSIALNHFDEPDSQPYSVEKEYIICAPLMP